jgi:Ca-activated chloride channel family protein
MLEMVWPWVFIVLPLPLLVAVLFPAAKREEAALRVPFYAEAAHFESRVFSNRSRSFIRRTLLLIAWIALVVAASRPQWIGDPIALPASGRDLMLAVDISGSMAQEDMQINGQPTTRLTVVKNVVGDFVERRQGDRLGLILFGSQAYLQTPLTFDRKTVRTLLDETPIAIAGKQTAIGDAIGLTVKRLRKRPEASRVLVLLTDGASNAGEMKPVQATQLAAQENIKIYTVGVGADEMVVSGFFFDQKVNPSRDLDEDTLREIASMTGGKYYRARNTRELEQIYADLDQQEPIEQDLETYRPVKALFYYPLAVAFAITILLSVINALVLDWIRGYWSRITESETAEPQTIESSGESSP